MLAEPKLVSSIPLLPRPPMSGEAPAPHEDYIRMIPPAPPVNNQFAMMGALSRSFRCCSASLSPTPFIRYDYRRLRLALRSANECPPEPGSAIFHFPSHRLLNCNSRFHRLLEEMGCPMRMGIHWQDLLNSCVHRATLSNLTQRSHRTQQAPVWSTHRRLRFCLYCEATNNLPSQSSSDITSGLP